MQLYDFPASAWCRRVTIYVAEKELDIPRIRVNIHKGEQCSPDFLKINPAGKVPVLKTDSGHFLTESGAIVEYLEELYPDPSMMGTDADSRAHIRALDRICTEAFWHMTTYVTQTHPYFLTRFGRPVVQSVDVARFSLENLAPLLIVLDLELQSTPFLGASKPTIADCTLFAGAFMAERFGYQFPESVPRLTDWYQQFSARPSTAVQ